MAPRPGLDRDIIVEAAGELADADGLDKLTLAAVAQHLGVRTPSLYNHIEGLDGLRRDLSIMGMKELDSRLRTAALGRSQDDALHSMLIAYREFAKERPGVYEATLHAPNPDDLQVQAASEAIIDTVLTVLAPYRLQTDDAVHVIRGFRAISHGFVSLEGAGAFGIAVGTDESYERLISVFLRGLHALSGGSAG